MFRLLASICLSEYDLAALIRPWTIPSGVGEFTLQSARSRSRVGSLWRWAGRLSTQRFRSLSTLLRRDLAHGGTLHKYHTTEGEVDNDFFFVLGQVERRKRDRASALAVEENIRKHLSESNALDLVVGADALSFAAYEETTLALKRTRQFSLQEIAASADPPINLYDDAG